MRSSPTSLCRTLLQVIQLDEEADELVHKATISHAYPVTHLQWAPANAVRKEGKDVVATVGDYLRLWSVAADPGSDDAVERISRPDHLYDSNKTKNSCTPLTNMDWCTAATNIIGCCSIDPVCCIWDLEKAKISAKILAHPSASIYDLKFRPNGAHVFATCGSDGSLRLFDLRNLQTSAIVYEEPQEKKDNGLLRIGWRHMSPTMIAVLGAEGTKVDIIDIRKPMKPVQSLKRHRFPVNALAWAPHSDVHIATAGEDMNTFIWNLEGERFKKSGDPLLEYCAKGCINNMVWSELQPSWLSIAYDRRVELLLV